jgi:gamma-glutamylcyclotransferase (GGCT)/AIG2-like uncharacterized protein YtfP
MTPVLSRRDQLQQMVASANAARRAGDAVDPGIVRALGDPDRRLVAYGTLRPGEVNEDVLADARGVWTAATVRGVFGAWHGYPILRPAADAPAVAVMVLTSDDLPGLWPRLDRFEGPPYRREWVVYDVGEACGAGSCYVEAAVQT